MGDTAEAPEPSPQEAQAEAFKAEANEAFKACRYAAAADLYTKAVELSPRNAVYLSNRAFAYTRLEQYGSAIADATAAIEIDPTYVKAYYRRGSASLLLGKYEQGLKDFRSVAKALPRDPDARKKLKECEAAVRKMRFEAAIAADDAGAAPLYDTVDPKEMAVEEGYDGARMEGEGMDVVTLDFVRKMVEDFKDQKKLHRRFATEVVLQARDVLKAHATLMDIPVPEGTHFTVCGDVHGQYYDLLNIFELNGLPSTENPYLFNGDFVDRGSFSVEVILTLFAFKVLYPTGLYLTRGNHETKAMNKIYGFDGEVRAKYNETLANLFAEVFCFLPLGAVIGEKVMCVHGGLFSSDDVTLDDLRAIDRVREPPDEGLMCESLWSDPMPFRGRSPSKRGVGVAFGPDVTQAFLERNGLELLVRSHEVKDDGYEVAHDGMCVTVFSAPNYCDSMGNKGAFIRFESDMVPHFTQFSHVPHPAIRPMQYVNNSFLNFM